MRDYFIPDLHSPFFGLPVLEGVKHLSPLEKGEKKKKKKRDRKRSSKKVLTLLDLFLHGITFFFFICSYLIWTFLTKEYK